MEEPICEHFRRAAEMVGRRWVPELLRVLIEGPARYGEIRSAIPGISDHLLSERLRSLEASGVVVRTVVPSSPVHVEYALTPKGADLTGSITALAAWAERWARTDEPAAHAERRPPRAAR